MSTHLEPRERLVQLEMALDSWRRIAAMYRRRLADDALDASLDELTDTLDSLGHAVRMAEDAADALARELEADDLAQRIVRGDVR